MENQDLGHTKITDKIRVSSAGIFREDGIWGKHFIVETWCFSDDPRQNSFQVIHGTPSRITDFYKKKITKIHNYIANNLKNKYSEEKS